MATKATHRSFQKIQNGQEPLSDRYHNKEYMNNYGIAYAKKHYRTIGFKLNVESEKEVIAYLDYQPVLKTYLKELILADMKKNPELVQEAMETYESLQGVKKGDIEMRCPNCGNTSIIRKKSYLEDPSKRLCIKCSTQMEAVNPPEEDK